MLNIPTRPIIIDENDPIPKKWVLLLIFKGEIDAYIKRKGILDNNIKKAYSLVLGQCTDLLQSKLKQQANLAENVADTMSAKIPDLTRHANLSPTYWNVSAWYIGDNPPNSLWISVSFLVSGLAGNVEIRVCQEGPRHDRYDDTLPTF